MAEINEVVKAKEESARARKRTPEQFAERYNQLRDIADRKGMQVIIILENIPSDIESVMNAPDDSYASIMVATSEGVAMMPTERYHLYRSGAPRAKDENQDASKMVSEVTRFMALQAKVVEQASTLAMKSLEATTKVVEDASKLASKATKATRKRVKAEQQKTEAIAGLDGGIGGIVKDVVPLVAAGMGPERFSKLIRSGATFFEKMFSGKATGEKKGAKKNAKRKSRNHPARTTRKSAAKKRSNGKQSRRKGASAR